MRRSTSPSGSLLGDEPAAVAAAKKLWVAYSGGLDSTVLLHQLAQRRIPGLRAVHVHHGLQPAAEDWVRHCRRMCRALGVPLRVLRVVVPRRSADGPEAAARSARYQALGALLRDGEVLATAHHQDDQAETVLLRLLRGTGVAGLAGIAECSAFAAGHLWRPLLKVPRQSLQAYAEQAGLSWIEDPHNADPRYARSYLRAEILPRLQRHWPQLAPSLTRLSRLAAEATQLLDVLAAQDLAQAATGEALDIAVLRGWSPARRNNLLRYWLAGLGGEAPAAAVLGRLESEVLGAKTDAQPVLACGPYEFRRYRERLFVMARLPPPPGPLPLAWTGAVLELPAGCGQLRRRTRAAGPLIVRFAAGGERLRLHTDAPERTLKNLFQEHGVPPWVRQRVPLVYRGAELLTVADLFQGERASQLGLRLVWRHTLPGAAMAKNPGEETP